MKTKKTRPVNLDLQTINFPLSALVSISHRVSGVAIFVGIACLLWLLKSSLTSYEGFVAVKDLLANPLSKLLMWGFLSLLSFHIVAGVRHLIMDLGFFEELESGNKSAKSSFIITAILSILMGVLVW